MREELKDKVETWIYGIVVGAWAFYAFLADVVKIQFLSQLQPQRRIEWGMIVIATILYMLLRKVLNLKRQSRIIQTFETFATGISAALCAKSGASLDIFALSTQTILHHIAYDKTTNFSRVRILMPTDNAVKAFYDEHHVELSVNSSTAVETIKAQIRESILLWEGMKTAGRVVDLAIKRIEVFPTTYLAVIAEGSAFTGNYYLDGMANHHGLSLAETYIFSGKQSPAPQIKRWFESFWKAGK